jgi:tRNA-splicing ligase RtcB
MRTSTPAETPTLIPTGDATALLPARTEDRSPVRVFANEAIRQGFDAGCLVQAQNAREGPGVTDVVLGPDAHFGYGAPVGCVLASPTHIYPGPVGVDIKCSMSLLQTDVPEDAIADPRVRRALIDAIEARTPTGAGRGQRDAPKARQFDEEAGRLAAIAGASPSVLERYGIPAAWADRCEDAQHVGHGGTHGNLAARLDFLSATGRFPKLASKLRQIGSYGGGNHFGEAEVVRVAPGQEATAQAFGLKNGHVAFLSHCGSRGFGFHLANLHFDALKKHFADWNIPLPAGDAQLAYAPLGSPEADAYLDDMAMGANFATVNHLLINALVLEAFQEVLPGTTGQLVYLISHNIARQEVVRGSLSWVHRKGATRAFPAGHHALRETPFAATGHPILLPGNPQAGSAVMVGLPGAEASLYSVNHGAGRQMGRRAAFRTLDQAQVDRSFAERDILTNTRHYPLDESPAAYKDFEQVLASVEQAGLAQTVARLDARFVIKDADKSLKGAA